ncbi:MAG TPA: hypothetical protein VF593_07020 [Chthoniobacteraceae bacterium]|jgi:two-component system chemotaxis response regulator CheB
MSADPFPATNQPAGNDQGVIVPWACPDCSGTIWETRQGPLVEFHCRVGHAYSAAGFLEEQSDTIERTLWAAIRLLEERAALADHLAEDAAAHRETEAHTQMTADAVRHRGKAAELRRVIAS